MKMTKFWEKDDKSTDFHYCKKCGCELISTNKNKLCDKCRRDKASMVKKVATGIIGLGVLIVIRKKK